MANKGKFPRIKEEVERVIEELAGALNDLFNKQRPKQAPIPVPVDRPYRPKK